MLSQSLSAATWTMQGLARSGSYGFFSENFMFTITMEVDGSVSSSSGEAFEGAIQSFSLSYNSGQYEGFATNFDLLQYYGRDVFGPDDVDGLRTSNFPNASLFFPDADGASFDPFGSILELTFPNGFLLQGKLAKAHLVTSFSSGYVELNFPNSTGESSFLSGEITSITAVPEPAYAALFVSAFTLLTVLIIRARKAVVSCGD